MRLFGKNIDKQIETYQRELVDTHYKEVDNMYRQIRGWRHDYRNHIQVLMALADKVEQEALYDGLYAVSTDLLDDPVGDILSVSEGRWEIEECFRIMKTDFEARPVFLQNNDRIKAHFLTCFLALIVYRYLEKRIDDSYTCDEILSALRGMNFADIKEQGFMPTYRRTKLTDKLHEACGFRTDYEFITKSQMKTIQKKSKGK